jgi:hypothetical protein
MNSSIAQETTNQISTGTFVPVKQKSAGIPSQMTPTKASDQALPLAQRTVGLKQRALFVMTPFGPVAFRLPMAQSTYTVEGRGRMHVLYVITPEGVYEYMNARFACMPLFDLENPKSFNVRALHFGCRMFFGLKPRSAEAQQLFKFLVAVPSQEDRYWVGLNDL